MPATRRPSALLTRLMANPTTELVFTPLRPCHATEPFTALATIPKHPDLLTIGGGWLMFHCNTVISRSELCGVGSNTYRSSEMRPEFLATADYYAS